MASATNQQIQAFSDNYIRPFCEAARALQMAAANIPASDNDVYAALTQANPTWTDERSDGPPHLMMPSDILAVNAFAAAISSAMTGNANWPVILACCISQVS